MAALVGCRSTDPGPTGGPPSLYRLEIEPCLGLRTRQATAFAVGRTRDGTADPATDDGPVRLLTAAHSFQQAARAEARDITGRLRPVSVVHLDLDRDIAVLEIDSTESGTAGSRGDTVETDDRPFRLVEPERGSDVEIRTYADVAGPAVKTGTIVRLVNATLDGRGRRRAVELADVEVEPGDSGAPVVDGNGDAVAMVFASARGEQRAWAISSTELRDALAAVDDPTHAGPDPPCSRPTRPGDA